MKSFSQFTPKESLELVGVKEVLPWRWTGEAVEVPETLSTMIAMAEVHFDLKGSEANREVLIDLILLTAVDPFDTLRFWKEATLESSIGSGSVDYLLAHRAAFFESPLLCVVEAKRDDFDSGRAQCLAEFAACHQVNSDAGCPISPLHGIVTNGSGWMFLRWFPEEKRCEETPLYAQTNLDEVLGILRDIFAECERLDAAIS